MIQTTVSLHLNEINKKVQNSIAKAMTNDSFLKIVVNRYNPEDNSMSIKRDTDGLVLGCLSMDEPQSLLYAARRYRVKGILALGDATPEGEVQLQVTYEDKIEPMEQNALTFPVVGIGHNCNEAVIERIKSLADGAVLTLRPEPDNEKDARAIAVCLDDGTKIGYLPAQHTSDVHYLIDSGLYRHCVVDRIEKWSDLPSVRANLFCFSDQSVISLLFLRECSEAVISKSTSLYIRYKGTLDSGEENWIVGDDCAFRTNLFAQLPDELKEFFIFKMKDRMAKANTVNPTNKDFFMSVPHDLDVYGVTWETLDLSSDLVNRMYKENYLFAQFLRASRTSPGQYISFQNFEDEAKKVHPYPTDLLMQRIRRYSESRGLLAK